MKRFGLLCACLLLFAACEKKAEETGTPDSIDKEEPKPVVEKEIAKEAPKEDALGTWVAMDAYGVKFRVPKEWNVERTATSSTATDPEGTTTAMLVGSDSSDFVQAALENIKKEIKFEDVNLTRSGVKTINGMPGYDANGTAVVVKGEDKQEIQFLMNSVKVGDKAAALLIFAEAEMYEAKKEEIDGLANTLNKL